MRALYEEVARIMNIPWIEKLPFPVTVCGRDGTILFMNEPSARMFEKSGGASLVGKNLLDCHPEPSRTKLAEMLRLGTPNTYTIEKNGIKKMIHQAPWFENGEYAGLVEVAFPIPDELPHFKRT